MVILLENPDISVEQLKERYYELLEDDGFVNCIRGPTTDTLVLRSRLKNSKKISD